MNVAVDAPARPALRYYGGKWNLAQWIISHFPPHQNYVEPCGGAASVLLQKPRSPLETYNDLDGNVVNFFRVLRDRPDELIRAIRLTPWARAEFEACRQAADDPMEKARRFYVLTSMSMHGGSNGHASDWQHWRDWIDSHHKSPEKQMGDIEDIYRVAYRLQHVQVEQRDYAEVVTMYDHPNSLIYFDPPYVTETRAQAERYAHEWTATQHAEAAALLCQCAGYVVVSGYACDLYAELYEAHGWQRVDKEAQTNSGGKRIESLWLSPRTWAALHHDYSDLPLFG